MNILLVSDVYLPTVSGVASSSDSIARYMAQRGHHVYLICPRPVIPYTAPAQDHLDIIYTPTLRDPFFVDKSMAIFPMGIVEIWKTIASHHIDIIHIQEPGTLGIMALWFSRLYRLPTVGAMHFSLEQFVRMTPRLLRPFSEPFIRLYIRMIYPKYTAIMMPTATVTKDLAAIIGHPERIHAVSNGVDTSAYMPTTSSPVHLRRRYHLNSKDVCFMYLGRLDADKNIETIIRAFAKTRGAFRLILAGVGKQQQLLQQLVKKQGIEARVTWVQNLSQRHIIELYQLSDVFVIMSPVETQSIVTLQAIACGLPVLAADAGALPELVKDGKNGYLIPTFDELTLADKMSYLAAHPDIRKKMGKESRKLSLVHHKPLALRKLEKLYESLIRG